MPLSIIIVNYNVKHFLEQCLHSVQAAMEGINVEVIVVDNNSTDGSLNYLKPKFPWVKWIANIQNTGFAVANNQAAEVATGEYILFLNPDTLLPEDCLHQCLLFFKEHLKAGALGIRMLDGSGRFLRESKRAFPGPLTSFFKLAGLASLFPKSTFFARYHLGHLPEHQNHPVDVLAGAFMLVRKKVLDDIGAFDGRFFMYGEDIDLSYRIQKAGWQNWYFTGSSIIHFKGESTKKGSLNYVRMFYKAMYVFVQKHYSGNRAFLFRSFIQIAIWLRASLSVLSTFAKWMGGQVLPKTGRRRPEKMLIVASQLAYEEVVGLLRLASLTDAVPGRIAPGTNIQGSVGQLAQLSSLLKAMPVEEIIFCIDEELDMRRAVTIMQQQLKLRYAFHYHNSKSIVGSNTKGVQMAPQ